MAVVKECIRALEDSPLTNAGIGSQVNRDCKVECDASIVDGYTQNGASVCAVPDASNAIDIAHLLTIRGGPACLAGEGALRWFIGNGGENARRDLITESQRKMFAKRSALLGGRNTKSPDPDEEVAFDTVGAVVLLGGMISAGVSSGGTFLKYPGRVGQAGVYGAGCWANHSVGISTSGTGEHLIRTLLASRCVDALGIPSTTYDDTRNSTPPVMRLQTFLERNFVSSPLVSGEANPYGAAAGIIGIVYDEASQSCDFVWAHTSANFMLAYSSGKSDRVHVKICSQPEIEDIEKVKVYASGKTVRLRRGGNTPKEPNECAEN
ncbi:threonine aspartase 1 [Galendromus occidentalis]|uniref:Threonine aspartase 1 n=1 Tax=Galendromus occidentalis TaxID=34638 RepID=A0AAJ6QVY8_9ACAR|nr:threonine aspartase 1 [Galendromus occidentalis]